MDESNSLDKKKIVLITGASGGIGTACARRFAEEGFYLIICGRNINKLIELAKELEATYEAKVFYYAFDITIFSQVEDFIRNLPDDFTDIDILINNAGLAKGFDKLHESNIADIECMINCNIKGMLYLSNLVTKSMVKRNSGHIFNICSISGHVVYPKGTVYCATKHAVLAISQGLRMDLIGTKIRVSIISPGLVKTGFNSVRFGNAELGEHSYQGVQFLLPEDVADVILYSAKLPLRVNIDEIIIMPQEQVAVTVLNKYNN